MSSAEAPTRRRATWIAAVVALLVGAVAAVALVVVFTVVGDPCPDFEDEGPMAAPDSPYGRVMCQSAVTLEPVPMEQISIPVALLVSTAIALAGAMVLVWRRPRIATRRSVAAGVLAVLLVQPLLIVALHYVLPRDCLSGRTNAGECGRDREDR